MKKRFLPLLLAVVLCLNLIPTAFAASFTDTKPGVYYYVPVLWAVEEGITSGTSSTTFSPDETCTTGQILTFLWRSEGQPAPTGANHFTDVSDTDYFSSAARWANEKGLVSGTVLNPNAPCTRSMVVTYLWKLSGSPSAGSSSFTDVPASAEYAPAVAWAVAQGITGGTSETTFAPQNACTRGQIVTFLHRYSGSPNVAPVVTPYASFPSVPDFGAYAFVSPTQSSVKGNAHYYYYDHTEIAAKNSNRDFKTILTEYLKLLEANGFSNIYLYTVDEGPIAVYASSDTLFSLGSSSKDRAIAIMMRPISDLAASITSDDGKYYKECTGVPDFSAATGILPAEVSPREDGWTFTYDISNGKKEQIDKYVKLLADEGFSISDADVNSVGVAYIQITKGEINIIFVESGNSLVIAVYL